MSVEPDGRSAQPRPSPTSTETDRVSTAPSSVPPPQHVRVQREEGRPVSSSPPLTPFPFLGGGKSPAETTDSRKSVRFNEKPMMAFYKPSLSDIREAQSKSNPMAVFRRRGIFSTPGPKSAPRNLSTKSSFVPPSSSNTTSNPLDTGVAVEQGNVQPSPFLDRMGVLGGHTTTDNNLGSLNFSGGLETFNKKMKAGQSVSKESLEKVRNMMRKRKMSPIQRQSTLDLTSLESQKATKNFSNSAISSITARENGEMSRQGPDAKKAKVRDGEDHPSEQIETIVEPGNANSTEAGEDWSSTGATVAGSARTGPAESVDKGPVFKVPTNPAPSKHKSYYTSKGTPQGPETEKTMSTIPMRPQKRQPGPSSIIDLSSIKRGLNLFGESDLGTDNFGKSDLGTDNFFLIGQLNPKDPGGEALLMSNSRCVTPRMRSHHIFGEGSVLSTVKRPQDNSQTTPALSSIDGPGAALRILGDTNLNRDTPISAITTTGRSEACEAAPVLEKEKINPPARVKGNNAKEMNTTAGSTSKSGAPSGISSIRPQQDKKGQNNSPECEETAADSDGRFGSRIKSVVEAAETGTLYSRARLSRKTTDKLMSFGLKLKNLTDPGKGKATPATSKKSNTRHDLVTPRQTNTKTPESRFRSGATVNMTMTMDLPDPKSFAAVYEGTGTAAGEVGVASFSLSSPGLVVCQFSDSKNYSLTISKMMSINPSQILVPEGGSGSAVKLYEDIEARMTNSRVVRVLRKHFSESRGLAKIKQLVVPEFASVEMQFNNKYFCLAAAAALLKVSHNLQFKLN